MRELSIIIFIVLSSVKSFSQDSAWKDIVVDENLTVSFPRLASQMDTVIRKDGKEMRLRFIKSESTYSTLGLAVTPNETNINVNNEESLQIALAGIAKGALETMSENGLECSVTDTTIDGLPCKKLKCQGENILSAVNYLFLVNDKMYSFQAYSQLSNSTLPDIKRLLKSIHFNKSSIKEQQFGSRAEAIGALVGKLAMATVVIIGIIYFVRTKMK